MISKNGKIANYLKQEKSISILLGAGFSAPMGYPVGKQLNERILFCIDCECCFSFSNSGELYIRNDGTKPDVEYKNPYDRYFDFCKDTIRHYNKNIKRFDYEEFYDYLKEKAKDDSGLREFFEKGHYNKIDGFEQYVYQIDNIYSQLVAFYLKDSAGKSFYDDEHEYLEAFDGYTGFLNCIESLSKDYIINVHTLNHDLFFERLNRTKWINGELCDGFEELGSPYYGKLQCGNRTYKCRLPRYTEKYNGKMRLYKLHGSIDYYVYHTNKDGVFYPDRHIKTRWGIDVTDFYKEINKEGEVLEYENCWINYHPDFLTGTTAKIRRYQEPFYKKLFELFKQNLNKAEILIIIGYGCNDSEINHYILEEFGAGKPCFVIDPKVDNTAKLKVNAKWIEKEIENLSMEDFSKK